MKYHVLLEHMVGIAKETALAPIPITIPATLSMEHAYTAYLDTKGNL